MARKFFTSLFLFTIFLLDMTHAQESVARQWNEQLLFSIRRDYARPTVHARNLFHISAAMYDAWAAYDTIAKPFLLGRTVSGFTCPFNGMPAPADVKAAREEAISYAAYRIMKHRFQNAPPLNVATIQNALDNLMLSLEYNPAITTTDYSTGSAAALGNYIAQYYISFGLQDGANELGGYGNLYYQPVNPPLNVPQPGNPDIIDYNRWQQLALDSFVDQAGNVLLVAPNFLSPEWGNVTPFSLNSDDLTIKQRDGYDWLLYHDPGPPPLLDVNTGGGTSDDYKWSFELVSVWSSHLSEDDSVMWDISPAGIGNIQHYPDSFPEYYDFYNLEEGGDNSPGYDINPKTGQPYEPQLVPRGDYARVLAEFWADGPASETPPGHWFTILNYVHDHPLFERRYRGQGPIIDDLEWDVKAYFALGGAMHDVAISIWGLKGYYDYLRPVSAIRAMADLGQSTSDTLPHYHPGGMKLIPGFIELVEAGDPLEGVNGQNINKVKIKAWKGPSYIANPAIDDAGVDWILAENWWPYQRPSFVSPPFAGYISGHSTYSRAAAEVLTLLTGDEYFPGGMGEFEAPKNEFLVFEEGPSQDVTLQWAKYRDASDQCSLSRIWGGIHPPADDIPGRRIGSIIGPEAFDYAEAFFFNDTDNDGFYNYQDCDDNNAAINPDAAEVCDGIDNNCNGMVDDGLAFTTYYLDLDGDGYGDAVATLDTCLLTAPAGYVANALDCDDNNMSLNPDAAEICDGIDNDCNGMADDGLTINTFYLDSDEDGYGNAAALVDTCLLTAPAGYVTNGLDCDDGNPDLNPGMAEVCDGVDNNCNGMVDDGLLIFMYFEDLDDDSFGNPDSALGTCESDPPAGYVFNDLDCDDTNPDINPNAMEIMDNLDNDCNGIVDDLSGIADISQSSIRLFPNPVLDALTIECDFNGQLTARLFRADGILVRTSLLDFSHHTTTMAMDDIPQGVYWIMLSDTTGKQRYISKVVRM
ncbi:MAG: MopE-related protein [Saprospiraceae bacterium]